MRPTLSISLYVTGKRVVVIGNTPGAADRVRRLEAAGAHVTLSVDGADLDFEGVAIVFAHTDDVDTDRALCLQAKAAGALGYAHDQPDVSDFAMPALVSRGPLSIAISTAATAPALSRRLREELDRVLSESGDDLDDFIAHLQQRRAELPKGRRGSLYEIASKLRFDGKLTIAD